MLTVEDMNKCPNCTSRAIGPKRVTEFGYINKVTGSAVKATRTLECSQCQTVVTEVWVINSRSMVSA